MTPVAFLIADDSSLARPVTELLRSWECEVHVTTDSKKAICAVGAIHPDVILCQDDIAPLSGRQLARLFKVHRTLSKVPFLLLVRDAEAAGIGTAEDEILATPLDRIRLAASLRKCLPPPAPPAGDWIRPSGRRRDSGAVNLPSVSRLLVNLIETRAGGALEIAGERRLMRAQINDGLLLDVQSNFIRDQTFLRFLLNTGVIDASAFDRAVELADELKAPHGRALVMLGALSKEEFADCLTTHKAAKFVRIFSADWNPAHYRFVKAAAPAAAGRPSDTMRPTPLTDLLLRGVMKTASYKDIQDAFVRHDVFDRPAALGGRFEQATGLLGLAPSDVATARQLVGRTVAELGCLSPRDYDHNLRLLFLLTAARAIRFRPRAAARALPAAVAPEREPAPPSTDDSPTLHGLLAESSRLLSENNLPGAQARLNRATSLFPASSQAMAMSAWTDYLRSERGRPEISAGFKERLKRAIALDDANADAYRYLANIVQDEGKRGLAEALFERAEKLKPTPIAKR